MNLNQTQQIEVKHSGWEQVYQSRFVCADDAVKQIKSGDRVVLGHACAEPQALVNALLKRAHELRNVEIMHLLSVNAARYCRKEYRNSFRHNSLFVGSSIREEVHAGTVDFTPCYFHEVPKLFRDGMMPVDAALITVSLPDEDGRVSLGISVDYTKEAALCAGTVIAEVNPCMPHTGAGSCLRVEDIDMFVNSDAPLAEVPHPRVGDTELTIGRYASKLIADGDCLQIGIGAIPEAVLSQLTDKNDLGVHTELLTDSIMPLVDSGVITCSRKNFMPGKIISNMAMGSQEFYSWLDRHPMVEFHPVDFTNDPFVIARNDNMVTINSALAIDLLGQVAADTIGPKQYSGVGGQVDFVRGAARSKGGKNLITLPATTKKGTVSRIVCTLEPGQAVTTSRHDVDYVATEYGLVQLKGRTLRQRSEALVSIAAPQFRDQLREQCKELYGW